MTKSAHSPAIAKKFCKLCDWLMQIYEMRKFLFDENSDVSKLQTPRHAHFFYRLQEVLQENWLHQLAKLHDPAVQGGAKGHINLSVPYMIEYGDWDLQVRTKLIDLQSKMTTLANPIRDARNKVLSHNDLAVLLADAQLGGFDPGADDLYFEALKEFASVVSETVLGEPFLRDDLVKNDVSVFMHQFIRGEET